MSSVISSKPQRRSASRAPGPELERIPALSPLPRTPGEPVDQRLVERADVPAPVVGHQLVGLRVAEAEPALPVRAEPGLVDLARARVARRSRRRGRDRARHQPVPCSNGAGKTESSITSSTEPMSKTTAAIT